jgi:hypothetical protein
MQAFLSFFPTFPVAIRYQIKKQGFTGPKKRAKSREAIEDLELSRELVKQVLSQNPMIRSSCVLPTFAAKSEGLGSFGRT